MALWEGGGHFGPTYQIWVPLQILTPLDRLLLIFGNVKRVSLFFFYFFFIIKFLYFIFWVLEAKRRLKKETCKKVKIYYCFFFVFNVSKKNKFQLKASFSAIQQTFSIIFSNFMFFFWPPQNSKSMALLSHLQGKS